MREYSIILLILSLLILSAQGQENTADDLVKANELNNKGEYNASVPLYDKVISKDPKNAEAWNGRGLALQNMNKHYESISCFDKATQINPSYKEAYWNKGYSLIKLNRYPEARECEKKALEIDPSYCEAINDMGLSYYEERRYEDALEWYSKVIGDKSRNIVGICPTMAVTWVNKALVLFDMGQQDQAIEAYKKAKEYGFKGSSECDKRFGAFI